MLNDITLISRDGCRFPLVINNITEPRYGMVAPVLALPPHSKKVMGLIPAWGAVGSGGQVLSVWSLHVLPVFTRGFLH